MKLLLALLVGAFLTGAAAADTVLFSFKAVQTAASNDVVRAQNFIEQTALNATAKCLDEGLFARKYWIAVAGELTMVLRTPNVTPAAVRQALCTENLPRDKNSETMLAILLNAHETLYNDFAKQKRAPEVGRAFAESLRKGITSALQASTLLSNASATAP